MKAPPIRIPAESMTNPGAEAVFREMFGDDFEAHRVVGFISGPSPDNKTLCITFRRADGGVTNVSMDADLVATFAGCLASTWQHLSDQHAIEGPPKGNA